MYFMPSIQPYPEIYMNRIIEQPSQQQMLGVTQAVMQQQVPNNDKLLLKDYGREPIIMNINTLAKLNQMYRTTLWTGNHFQIALMSIGPGEELGLEAHPNVDQVLRIEQGQGIVQLGRAKDQVDLTKDVFGDYAIVIPAGTWHNLINTGITPMKIYSIYANPFHPFGTVQMTKASEKPLK